MLSDFLTIFKSNKTREAETKGVLRSYYNDWLTAGQGFHQRNTRMSYNILRDLSMKDSVIAAIIRTRVLQTKNFCHIARWTGEAGYRVRHKEIDHKTTKKEREVINRLEDFIYRCGLREISFSGRDIFTDFITKWIQDQLVFDQCGVERIWTKNNKMCGFRVLDGSTIRRADDEKEEEGYKYVQYIEDTAQAIFFKEEECFMPVMFPSPTLNSYGYGVSPLELLVRVCTAHLNSEEKNMRRVNPNAPPDGLLVIEGQKVSQDIIDAVGRIWLNSGSGLAAAHRFNAINLPQGKISFVDLGKYIQDMDNARWTDYLINMACAMYGIDPAEINFPNRGGMGEKAPMFQTGEEARLVHSKDKGLSPLLNFISDQITMNIVEYCEDGEDFKFEFVGINHNEEMTKVKLLHEKVQCYLTINEARKSEDLPAIEGGDIVLSQVFTSYLSQKEAMASQEGEEGEEEEEGEGWSLEGEEEGESEEEEGTNKKANEEQPEETEEEPEETPED